LDLQLPSINRMASRKHFLRRRRFWLRLLLVAVGFPLLVILLAVSILINRQDEVVQEVISHANADFAGKVRLRDSHLDLVHNFPYISIDLDDLEVFESKDTTCDPLLHVVDAFLGFDLWTVLSGRMEISEIKLKGGDIHLVQHVDGSFNLQNALTPTSSGQEKLDDIEEEFHLDLREIVIEELDLNKLNEANDILLDTYISKARSRFRMKDSVTHVSLDAQFMLNLIVSGDTTFIKHKHFDLRTQLDYNDTTEVLVISPTEASLEGSTFRLEGSVDLLQDGLLDIRFSGHKPDFGLFFAMAPEEMIPVLSVYENQGDITFEATVQGACMNGNVPRVEATFACSQAHFNNTATGKRMDELGFRGRFTTGDMCNLSTMELEVTNFTAKPEAGTFTGDLHVKNFESPDIDLRLNSSFELDFLAKFFNLRQLNGLDGAVELTMNFHDIIDLRFPERSIEKLNESYFTQLKVQDLTFSTDVYSLPIDDVDLYAEIQGHELRLDYLNVKAGKSDIAIQGTLNDFPAVLHHTDIPVDVRLNFQSRMLDLFELTGADSLKSFDEQVQDFSMKLDFKSSARAITESPHLPVGEFFIEDLHAKLRHYPHRLHDFHADIFIEDDNLRIVDFTGMIDKSDFHFSGGLTNYAMLMQKHRAGDTRVEYNLTSNMLQLSDIFSYRGENHVPQDYRHEEFDKLRLHGFALLHFQDSLQSVDATFDHLEAKMKLHHLRFEQFRGRIHYEADHLMVQDFSGRMGHSDFKTTLHYYLGKDETVKKRDNYFSLTSGRLDLDELLLYNPPPTDTAGKVDHDAGFNLYALPFTDMKFDVSVDHFSYQKYLLHNLRASLRTTSDHYIHLDKLNLDAADGRFDITGYFNGSDSTKIYFSPVVRFQHADLDKLMVKFDNFGQDHLLTENIHGQVSGTLTGKIHMHTDMVPKLDDSQIEMDVTVMNGRLEHYALLESMSDYFEDKNLKKVVFDTLSNKFSFSNGTLTIPSMTINSSLGFLEISGKQDMDLNMEYYIRVPWKMITQSASSKLFGKKVEEVDPDQVDEIQYADPEKKVRYLNLKITGTPEDYKIALGRDKSRKGR
jgi:hypothetical protein